MTKCNGKLIWLGGLLVLVALLTRSFIAGAEYEAKREYDRLTEYHVSTSGLGNGHRTEVLLTEPTNAALSHGIANKEAFAALPYRTLTPTLVVYEDLTEPLVLSTTFRELRLEALPASGNIVVLPLKPGYWVLTNLLYPGMALLAFGLWRNRSATITEDAVPTSRTFAASPIVAAAAPGRSQFMTASFEHATDTPEELRYGRFVKGEQVGQGAMGRVFRCHSCVYADTNDYALKVLLPEWSNNPDFRARFEREVDICNKLVHPNLVRAYERGEKGEELWMVMEFLEGMEWQAWLEKNKPDQTEILAVFEGLCAGLLHAHSQGVVHRDLKPENILVVSGRAVITDFGLAKSKQYATITKTNTTMGTPIYMPPEQVTGGHGSPQGDIYSLGCILYQSLAGVVPFPETDVLKLLTSKLNGAGPKPLDPELVDPALSRIVSKMMADNPLERYHSADEVSEALQAFRSRST